MRRSLRNIRKMTGRTVSAASVLLFIGALMIIFLSNRYMDLCIARESDARQNAVRLSELGDDLADTSDYLTSEARRFAVTGDITHLYNYWHEVCVERTRDNVIDELSSLDPPQNERDLLSGAKQYSDMLIGTETISMKLKLMSMGKTTVDYFYNDELYGYVEDVESCELPKEYENMPPDEMSRRSVEILFDAFYNESKSLIMTPIEDFRSAMNGRLDERVSEAEDGRKFASAMQIVGSVAVLILTGILVVGMNLLYIRPINHYAASLTDVNIKNSISDKDFSKVRVSPDGAYELYRFGEIFNHMSVILYKELKNRAEAEEKMRSARDEADRANDAKTTFFASMSHDLRTPLNAITGYLYILKETSLDDEQKKLCSGIEASSENLLGLINNVLDFSKIESGNLIFEETDFILDELIDDVVEITEISARRKGLEFRLERFGKLPEFVRGDPLRLKQVLINLAGNAVKFTSEGSVRLSVEFAGEHDGITVIEFGIRDIGIGISSENREKIFEPFVQSDGGIAEKYGGTGLGLPIADRIVREASGGKYHIELVSEPGAGSYFHFKYELKRGKAIPRKNASEKTSDSGSGKILLVDDNITNLEIEKRILQTFGLEVITAGSGAEAIEIAVRATAENSLPDIILLDLHMPDMDGFETAHRLREINSFKNIPIIALTADVISGTAEKIASSEINGYITKPFKPAKLHEEIEKYLDIIAEFPATAEDGSDLYFKVSEALLNIGGDKKLLADIIRRFSDTNKNSVKYIISHIENGNYGNARSILHDIKGSAGNLCCFKLSDAAAEMISDIDSGNTVNYDDFSDVFEKTMTELAVFLENDPSRISEKNNLKFEEIFDEFIKKCADYDIGAEDCFNENRDLFRNNLTGKEYKFIEDNLKRYDFEKILNFIKEERNV